MLRYVLLLFIILSAIARCELAAANNLVLSYGSSLYSGQPQGSLTEYRNRTDMVSIAWEGAHFGTSFDRNYGGDDAGNSYVTGYGIFRAHHEWTSVWPFNYAVAGAGIMVARHQLRQTGSYMNFHAFAGFEDPNLFGRFGYTLRWKHYSNGHIHAIMGPDNVPNPPRNVISTGIVIPF